jgi:hypothetical protein
MLMQVAFWVVPPGGFAAKRVAVKLGGEQA